MKYWTGDEYLSFGPCAASDFAGKRFTIAPDIEKYMEGVLNKGAILSECETVPMRERAGEYLMLRLRTVDGVEEGEYTKSFLLPFEPLEEVFQKLSKQDLCKNVSGRWRLTPKGFMLSNSSSSRNQSPSPRKNNVRRRKAARFHGFLAKAAKKN